MTYQLLLTTLGQQKLSAAASAGGQPVRITEFAVGQGLNVDFSKRLDQQVLVSKRYQGVVESVAATAVVGQYEITCIVPQNQGGWFIREIGLIDSAGDLIWVGQVPEVQKPVASSTAAIDYRIKAVISIDNPKVNLVIDANVVTATQSWVTKNFVTKPEFKEHLDDVDPHSQYLLKTDFKPFDEDALNEYVLKTTYVDHILNYDQHVDLNQQQHKNFTDWQTDHTDLLDEDGETKDPHPQYVSLSVFNAAIAALSKRIDELDLTGGTGTILSRLESSFSGTSNGYSQVSRTIQRVYITKNYVVDSEYNLIPLGDYSNSALTEVEVGSNDLLLYLAYPDTFDPALHEIRSSHPNFSETEDSTGITFLLPHTSESDADGAKKYKINASYYFEVVKK